MFSTEVVNSNPYKSYVIFMKTFTQLNDLHDPACSCRKPCSWKKEYDEYVRKNLAGTSYIHVSNQFHRSNLYNANIKTHRNQAIILFHCSSWMDRAMEVLCILACYSEILLIRKQLLYAAHTHSAICKNKRNSKKNLVPGPQILIISRYPQVSKVICVVCN